MSDHLNPGRADDSEATGSGLLLSVDPLEENTTLRASADDDAGGDTDASDSDDAAGDSDGGGATDADLADAGADAGDEGTADAMDIVGDTADATDAAKDADGKDAS